MYSRPRPPNRPQLDSHSVLASTTLENIYNHSNYVENEALPTPDTERWHVQSFYAEDVPTRPLDRTPAYPAPSLCCCSRLSSSRALRPRSTTPFSLPRYVCVNFYVIFSTHGPFYLSSLYAESFLGSSSTFARFRVFRLVSHILEYHLRSHLVFCLSCAAAFISSRSA